MAIQVERPSRTFEEQIREGISFILKGGIKLYFWGVIAFSVGITVAFTIGGPPGMGGGVSKFVGNLAGLATGLLILNWRYGKPLSEWAEYFQARPVAEAPPSVDPEIREDAQEAEQEEEGRFPAGTVLLGVELEGETEGDYVALEPELRNRHVYVVGKTRTGKTTLLRNMIVQDMDQENGVAFIDPHGDAAEELLGFVPEKRIEDLIYFDPRRTSAPSFNPFQLPYPAPKLTEDIVSVFRMLTGGGSWGPRMEHLLRFGVLTLLVDKAAGHTLARLRSLYLDPDFRSQVLARIENPQILEFWEHEYPMIPESASAPILNKLSAFLSPMSDLERVFSAPKNDLDFAGILNGEKILIVNLAKGTIGDEPARLLGGLLVAGIQQAALSRAALPPEARAPFYLYVDEFQNFTVASFESILSESAKYQLNLTLANQNLGQLSSSLQSSIFGNCATLVAFQVSADDAPQLRREMHRSRIAVRPKEETDFYSLDSFVREQQETYRAALTDKYLGMSVAERREFREMQRYGKANGLMAAARQGAAVGDYTAARRAQIERTLEILERDTIDLKTLRELFPDWEFREISFPDIDDFLNIPPRHAFCRIGSADNVICLRALTLEDRPSSTVRAAVEKHIEGFKAPVAAPEPPKTRRVEEPESFLE